MRSFFKSSLQTSRISKRAPSSSIRADMVFVGLFRTSALASRGRHRRLCSATDHQRVHQFLVQPFGDLLAVVEEDLLDLHLAHSRHIARRRVEQRPTIGQFLEAALHVDYLCVYRGAPRTGIGLRAVECFLPLAKFAEPIALALSRFQVKGRRKTCRRRRVVRTSRAVVTFLAASAAPVARNGAGRYFHRLELRLQPLSTAPP